MERVPYRRIMPSRNGNSTTHQARFTHETETVITPAEALIMQCIISGVIMVCILLITLVDIGATQTLRGGLEQALTGATTPQELVTEVQNLGNELRSLGELP